MRSGTRPPKFPRSWSVTCAWPPRPWETRMPGCAVATTESRRPFCSAPVVPARWAREGQCKEQDEGLSGSGFCPGPTWWPLPVPLRGQLLQPHATGHSHPRAGAVLSFCASVCFRTDGTLAGAPGSDTFSQERCLFPFKATPRIQPGRLPGSGVSRPPGNSSLHGSAFKGACGLSRWLGYLCMYIRMCASTGTPHRKVYFHLLVMPAYIGRYIYINFFLGGGIIPFPVF